MEKEQDFISGWEEVQTVKNTQKKKKKMHGNHLELQARVFRIVLVFMIATTGEC